MFVILILLGRDRLGTTKTGMFYKMKMGFLCENIHNKNKSCGRSGVAIIIFTLTQMWRHMMMS